MHVTISDLSPVEKKVAVEIPWQDVAVKLDQAYKDLSRGVALKGFRKGKVPRPILEKMFSQQVEQEVVKQLVQESFVAAAQKHDIQPVADPVVDDAHLHKGSSFHYSARVEVRSEVEPKEYTGVELSRRAISVSDEEVERAVEGKRRELTEFKKIEGRTEATTSDVVVISVQGKVGEHDWNKDGVMVDLSEPEREPLPGLAKALLGVSLSAKDLAVSFTVDGDVRQKELAGKQAQLKITISDSREKLVPALDDEFAKDTGEAETLVELKDKMRVKLVERDEERAKNELRAELVKAVLKKNPFAVAPALVERQLDVMVQRTKMQLAMQGIDPRQGLDETRLRDEMREQANDEVRAAFLIDAIATKEKVSTSEAELEKRLAEMATQAGKSVARLKAELQKEGRFEGIRHQIREEKTLDLLLSQAKINENASAGSSTGK